MESLFVLARVRELQRLLYERKVSQCPEDVRLAVENVLAAFAAQTAAAADDFSDLASRISDEASGRLSLTESTHTHSVDENDSLPSLIAMEELQAANLVVAEPQQPIIQEETMTERYRGGELAAMRSQGLVAALLANSAFRSSLETVVAGGAFAPLTARRQRVAAGGVGAGAGAEVGAPPPPSSEAETVNSNIRAPDEYYYDVLQPQPVTVAATLTRPRHNHHQQQQQQQDQHHHRPRNVAFDVESLANQATVSAILASSFRDRLERLIFNRLGRERAERSERRQQIQENPSRPQHQAPRVAPPTPTPSNPPVAHEEYNMRSYVHQPPFLGPSRHEIALERKVEALSNQIAEMQRMLQTSFEVTLDLQRSVRQEVAAALHANNNNSRNAENRGSTTVPFAYSAPSQPPSSSSSCVVCTDHPSDCVLLRCGHVCVCYSVGLTMMNEGHNCPICRAPVNDVARIFFA